MFELYGFGGALILGTWGTIQIMSASLLVGLTTGLIGAAAKLSGISILRRVTDFLTTIIRGIPELILILFVYFGGSIVLGKCAAFFGYDVYIEINPLLAAIVTLGTIYGAYATDVFRVSILAVSKGEIEAAESLGMKFGTILWRILIPQIWRYALPGLGNLFMILQKDTALVSVIGLNELMRNASQAVAFTKKPFTFYIAAAMIYLLITTVTTFVLHDLEDRAGKGVGRAV